MTYLTPREIEAFEPDPPPGDCSTLAIARALTKTINIRSPNQQFGLRWPVACVALEITQRCNLDCTLCYLSDVSEAIHDIPIAEVFRRIEMIRQYYGPNTDVQITGGDPTLRKREELVQIVRRIRERGLRPTLMTNGIRATRALLSELADAGLMDVAFHVDTTQKRKAYQSESDLNAVRETYIERSRGLGLQVFFNTTVHDENVFEVPDLVRFFRRHTDVVSLVSFQLAADTGRSEWRHKGAVASKELVSRLIEGGAGTILNFNSIQIGHPECNRFALGLSVNGNLYNVLERSDLVGAAQELTADLVWDRSKIPTTLLRYSVRAAKHPLLALRILAEVVRVLFGTRRDLLAARFRVKRLGFVIHDFMHDCRLEPERIDACVFKNMTQDGPMSMCLCNAKTDRGLLKPIPVEDEFGLKYWSPLNGRLQQNAKDAVVPLADVLTRKKLKGRARNGAYPPHIAKESTL